MDEPSRRSEKCQKDGQRSELNTGPLTAPLKRRPQAAKDPPAWYILAPLRRRLKSAAAEVHYNYVGGPPPSLWRSDYRGNLQAYVHTATANARMAQPTPLAVVSSPISLFPGVIGHPDAWLQVETPNRRNDSFRIGYDWLELLHSSTSYVLESLPGHVIVIDAVSFAR
ncbi:unnamed protein product [Symbiodinium sp. KB8]|nr:unnamed protein product [Symbiodinium sp. KB8]